MICPPLSFTPAGEGRFDGDGFLVKDVPLNDLLNFLAKHIGLNYFNNGEFYDPAYNVTGYLDVNVDPLRHMWDQAAKFGITIHSNGKTVYAMTAEQLAQLPETWKNRPRMVGQVIQEASTERKSVENMERSSSYANMKPRKLENMSQLADLMEGFSVDPKGGWFVRGAKLNDVFQFLAESADLIYSHNEEIAGPSYVVTVHLKVGDPIQQMEELSLMYGITIYRMGSTMHAATEAQLLKRSYQPSSYQNNIKIRISRLWQFSKPGETLLRSRNEEGGPVYLFDYNGCLRMMEVGANEKVATFEGLTVGAPLSIATHFYGEPQQRARLSSKDGDYVTYSFPSYDYADGKGRVYDLILVRLDKTGVIEHILVGYRDEG